MWCFSVFLSLNGWACISCQIFFEKIDFAKSLKIKAEQKKFKKSFIFIEKIIPICLQVQKKALPLHSLSGSNAATR